MSTVRLTLHKDIDLEDIKQRSQSSIVELKEVTYGEALLRQ